MTKSELNNEYFRWMCQLVYNEKYSRRLSYHKLLNHLHNREFTYIIEMDANRAEDGIDLRYRFGYERRYNDSMIGVSINNRPCSVLEMLVALSMRCEENIMDNPDIGNRMGQWFWNMLVNLGLESMSDSKFDMLYVDDIIHKFLNREYDQDGKGGLFTINHCRNDLRSIEIWYQMCWYLNDVS